MKTLKYYISLLCLLSLLPYIFSCEKEDTSLIEDDTTIIPDLVINVGENFIMGKNSCPSEGWSNVWINENSVTKLKKLCWFVTEGFPGAPQSCNGHTDVWFFQGTKKGIEKISLQLCKNSDPASSPYDPEEYVIKIEDGKPRYDQSSGFVVKSPFTVKYELTANMGVNPLRTIRVWYQVEQGSKFILQSETITDTKKLPWVKIVTVTNVARPLVLETGLEVPSNGGYGILSLKTYVNDKFLCENSEKINGMFIPHHYQNILWEK